MIGERQWQAMVAKDLEQQAEIARLTAERDARDRAKVVEGLRLAAEMLLPGPTTKAGLWAQRKARMRATILSRAKDMEAGNG